MTEIRSVNDEYGQKWLSVIDIAKKIDRDNAGLRQQIIKLNVVLKTIYYKSEGRGRKTLLFVNENDVPRILASLRIVGEFADSFNQIKTHVMEKGLDAISARKQLKVFQRFPDPVGYLPEKPIRASIVEYVRKVSIVTNKHCGVVFRTLYTEFKYRYNIDLLRHKDYPSGIDKCADLEKLQDLYLLARTMFDSLLPNEELIFTEMEEYEKLEEHCH